MMAAMVQQREICLSFRYRLLPSKAQHVALVRILEDQRQLYNAALEERIDAWRKARRSISYFDQTKALTACRREIPEMGALPVDLQRATLKRLDEAYRDLFRRVKAGKKAGFPRFKGRGWFNSFGFREFSGITLDGLRLRFKGMPGGLRVHLHRPLPEGRILSCTFRRDNKGWVVALVKRVAASGRRSDGSAIGIDLGIKNLAVLSNGTVIPNPYAARRAQKVLRRRQRALSRCRRCSAGSGKARAALARTHRMMANLRDTYLHQVSARLTRDYAAIAVEDLNVAGLSRSMLAREVNDAAWGKLLFMLGYKAERAGCELIKVDPMNTTQACSGCGAIVPKTLADRWHECPHCGLSLDRDHNAALNVLRRAVVGPWALNVAGCGERAPGNLTLEGVPE